MNIRKTLACLAAAAAMSLGTSAHTLAATLVTPATPPSGSFVTGPGCSQVANYVAAGSDGPWSHLSTGGFHGTFHSNPLTACDGSQYYAQTCVSTAYVCSRTSQGSAVRWHFTHDNPGISVQGYMVNVYIYIPTMYANDEGTPYTLSYTNDHGVHWNVFPAIYINQATKGGWYLISSDRYALVWTELRLEMNNQGPRRGEYAGASAAAVAIM